MAWSNGRVKLSQIHLSDSKLTVPRNLLNFPNYSFFAAFIYSDCNSNLENRYR